MIDFATAREIAAQPRIWRDWAPALETQAAEVRAWLDQIAPREIWLSGAGTSAFAGEIVAAEHPGCAAVATTDLVACPQDYLHRDGPVVAVQFGRSGDSSESVGMLDLLDAHRPDIHRLHITCNAEGALAQRAAPGPGTQRVITLPADTHDAGFAMTSSFSTMVLTARACLGGAPDLPALAERAEAMLSACTLPEMPSRIVFLGAGALTGAAREAALKVSELTAGRVATLWDSPLGFRHGPKAFVSNDTLIVVMTHPDPHTARFDGDLIAEVRQQFPRAPVMTIGAGGDVDSGAGWAAPEAAVLAVLPAQVWAAGWSADLGLNVDNPFEGHGTLTRVVAGVVLHPWAP